MSNERKIGSLAENSYTSNVFSCDGCNNKCTIKSYKFSNGNEYYTGNNCERVYSNKNEGKYEGENIFVIKNRLLFNRKGVAKSNITCFGNVRRVSILAHSIHGMWH